MKVQHKEGRSGGNVTSALMVICISGRQLCATEVVAQAAPSAVTESFANTTCLPLLLLRLRNSGMSLRIDAQQMRLLPGVLRCCTSTGRVLAVVILGCKAI